MISRYAKTGVDADKKGIDVFEPTVDNLFPGAFSVISQDPNDKRYGITWQSSMKRNLCLRIPKSALVVLSASTPARW